MSNGAVIGLLLRSRSDHLRQLAPSHAREQERFTLRYHCDILLCNGGCLVQRFLLRKERLELRHLLGLPRGGREMQRGQRLELVGELGSSRIGPGISHSALIVGAVQEGALIQRMEHLGAELRKRMLVRDLVKVRIAVLALGMLRQIGNLGARDGALHKLDQVGHSSQEELMVVRVAIDSLGADALEAPSIGLANETTELGVVKVRRNYLDFELTRLVNLPRTPVGHPADNVSELRPGKDRKQLGRESRDTSGDRNRLGWIRIGKV